MTAAAKYELPCDCGDHEGLADHWHDSRCPHITGVPRPLVYELRFEIERWELDVWVPGLPAPQGSKVAVARPNGTIWVKEDSETVQDWRADVRSTAVREWVGRPPLDGPLVLVVEFVRKRLKTAPKRSTPPATTPPDLDKLLRSTGDALKSAGVYVDDARTVTAVVHKRMAEIGEAPGAHVKLARWNGGWRI